MFGIEVMHSKLLAQMLPKMQFVRLKSQPRFLNQNGAFLVTKSGDKIARYFGISKYTLYSYIDAKQ